MTTTNKPFEINVSALINKLNRGGPGFRLNEGTRGDPAERVFVNISSTQVSSTAEKTSPTIDFLKVSKDLLNNPYIEINFDFNRKDGKTQGIKKFFIYRKKFSEFNIPEEFRESMNIKFDDLTVHKLSYNSKSKGKFSQEAKSYPYISNPAVKNLNILNQQPDDTEAVDYEKVFSSTGFEKIGEIDLTKFIEQQRRRLVFVEGKFWDLSYTDKSVEWNGVYEYVITSVSFDDRESARSESIKVKVDDRMPLSVPVAVNEGGLISVLPNKNEKIKEILVFKKDKRENQYRFLRKHKNFSDSVLIEPLTKEDEEQTVVQTRVLYTGGYYRIFSVDIYGEISPPLEIEPPLNKNISTASGLSLAQNAELSAENAPTVPIFSVEQKEGTTHVVVNISPNDPTISHYRIERRDITINETKFSVPSRDNTNYGGDGWDNGMFIVEQEKVPLANQSLAENENISALNYTYKLKEIEFIDDATDLGHIYEYRLKGYNLADAVTSCIFKKISIGSLVFLPKISNVRIKTIRRSPLRIKIMWEHQRVDGISYIVERRREGESRYRSFPPTKSNFIIDEIMTSDYVDFIEEAKDTNYEPPIPELTKEEEEQKAQIQNKIATLKRNSASSEDTRKQLHPIIDALQKKYDTIGVPTRIGRIQRGENMPDFLKENSVYYYRIVAQSDIPVKQRSNPTKEHKVYTYKSLAAPMNVKAFVRNTKVRPLFVTVAWETESLNKFFRPDRFIIEKKEDTQNSSWEVVGYSYLNTTFYDYSVEFGKNYLYRVTSEDLLGRKRVASNIAKYSIQPIRRGRGVRI